MTTLLNTFAGGTNGATVIAGTSGGASGNAFDTVNAPAGSVNIYDNTHAIHGTLADKLTAITTADCYCEWNVSIGSAAQYWFRQYLYFTANPAANQRVWAAVQTATLCGTVILLTTGNLRFANSSGTTITTTAATVPLNQWFRIEGFLVGSATVGQTELKLFTSADSTAPAETNTSAASQNTTGAPNLARFGVSTNPASNLSAFWQANVGLSSTGYIGPAAGRIRTRASLPSLIASM